MAHTPPAVLIKGPEKILSPFSKNEFTELLKAMALFSVLEEKCLCPASIRFLFVF
jgi:hypothetical protein